MSQTAWEFVRAQQAIHPPRHPTDEEVGAFADRFGLRQEDCAADNRDTAHRLLDRISPGLPSAVLILVQEGRVAVGEVEIDTANAYLKPMADGDFAVLFHSGLSRFIYRIARPLATGLTVDDQSPRNEAFDLPELARVIAEVFWWYQETGLAFGPSYDIRAEDILLASALTTYSESFLLAHELGHVYASQTDEWRQGCDPASELLREEHVADAVGVLTLLKAEMGPHPRALPVAYAGAELALQIWQLMESVGMSFVDGTHPPAADRVRHLRAFVRKNCASEDAFAALLSLALKIDGVFTRVGQVLLDPGEHDAAFERAASSVTEAALKLVRRCTGEMVPNYSTFYVEFPRLLAKGYPEAILERVVVKIAREMKAARQHLPKKSDWKSPPRWTHAEQAHIRQWGVNFQGFKLLYGVSKFLGSPVQELFTSVLDRELKDSSE